MEEVSDSLPIEEGCNNKAECSQTQLYEGSSLSCHPQEHMEKNDYIMKDTSAFVVEVVNNMEMSNFTLLEEKEYEKLDEIKKIMDFAEENAEEVFLNQEWDNKIHDLDEYNDYKMYCLNVYVANDIWNSINNQVFNPRLVPLTMVKCSRCWTIIDCFPSRTKRQVVIERCPFCKNMVGNSDKIERLKKTKLQLLKNKFLDVEMCNPTHKTKYYYM